MISVLSLGAGVQSTTLLLMSCLGLVPRLDAAIFADTGWEPSAVYEHFGWLQSFAAGKGIPVITVKHRNLREDLIKFRRSGKSGKDYTNVPLYLRDKNDRVGMARRSCTDKYKIRPVDKHIRAMLRERGETVAQVWLGITADEITRISRSRFSWKQHLYPFCGHRHNGGVLTEPWSREDCLGWLHDTFPLREVPRSSCIGCPYHSNEEWRRVKANPVEWADAIEVDEAIRNQENPSLIGTPFLHRSALPLVDADLSDKPQDDFFFGMSNECLGMCGN